MRKLIWTEDAVSDLDSLDKHVASRILKKITWLGSNFDSIVPEQLTGKLKGAYKLRVGDWRVVYTLEGKSVFIQAVGHRSEIYKN